VDARLAPRRRGHGRGVCGIASQWAAAALKILHTDFARDNSVRALPAEGYVSNKVNHPACAEGRRDDMTDDDEPFLVMELLEARRWRDAWKPPGA